ncbi:hypothetical protein D3C71_79040 [compost metagenome]
MPEDDNRLNLKATFFLMVLKMARQIGLSNEELARMFEPNMLKRAYNHIDAVDAERRLGVKHNQAR